MLSEDELRECEEDARKHGIPYMLDRMGLDGIGNDVCDLHKRILELEAEVAAFQKLKLTLIARLVECEDAINPDFGPDKAHQEADKAILDFIDDDDVREAFADVEKWYS